MIMEAVLDVARASKAAWDAGDTEEAAALMASLHDWATAEGGYVEQSSEGILMFVKEGAAEQLL